MGYTTDFDGHFTFSRTLTEEEKKYINTFSETRRMKRDTNKLQKQYQGKYGFNGQYGNDGEYFIGGQGYKSGVNGESESIIDHNTPPGQVPYKDKLQYKDYWAENETRIKQGLCQPGLWCQWVISDDGTKLEWNGSEKFYYYTEWLKYLIKHFFSVWNIHLNGEILYQGEEKKDKGNILIINNTVYLNMNIKDIRKLKLDNIEETL